MPRLLVAVLTAVLLLASSASAQSTRIWNGQETTAGDQYPWSVALVDPGNPDRAFCGGTLIDVDLVLTAAHCTIGTARDEIGVVLGLHDISGVTTASPNYRTVANLSLHPSAEVSEGQLRRDLSLLTLNAPAPVPAAPVPVGTDADLVPGAPAVATGWGLTESSVDTVDIKRWVDLELMDDGDCADQFDPIFGVGVFSDADQVCAILDVDGNTSTEDDIHDTCNGDSGGPLVVPRNDATITDPLDWELVGTTSWGLDCAFVDPDTGELYGGIYARTAGAQLQPYATGAIGAADLNPSQPEFLGGAVGVDADEDGIACFEGTTAWTPDVDQIDYLVRRRTGSTYETVSSSGLYFFDAGDAGDDFVCELHGRSAGAGGYGLARSGAVEAPTPPPAPPTVVQVPGPTVQVPGPTVQVPGPTVVQNVPVPTPRVDDTTAPKVSKVSRKCSKQRTCTFTVTTTDAKPSSGVASLSATATTIKARSCRKNGRRTVCARVTSRDLTVRRNRNGTFRVTTPKRLPKGTHTLVLVAADANGNVMAKPHRSSFRVR